MGMPQLAPSVMRAQTANPMPRAVSAIPTTWTPYGNGVGRGIQPLATPRLRTTASTRTPIRQSTPALLRPRRTDLFALSDVIAQTRRNTPQHATTVQLSGVMVPAYTRTGPGRWPCLPDAG